MYNFKSLRCCNCHSVMFNLPETEVIKLNGSQFRCECGYLNKLMGFKLIRTADNRLPFAGIMMNDSHKTPLACM